MNQAIYEQALSNGCTPRMAEMLAVRRVRIGITDTKYLAGFKMLGDELGPEHLRQVVGEARKRGYQPQASDVYLPNMARFPGDPQAFVSPSEGRSKIERVAAMRGMVKDGRGLSFKHRSPEQDPMDSAPPIAEDLVQREVRELVRENPEAAREPISKLRQRVIEKRGPSRGRKSRTVLPSK